MAIFFREEDVFVLAERQPGPVKVKYAPFRSNLPFEKRCESFEQALEVVDLLRAYDSHLEFHKKVKTYRPVAEFVQWGEGGDEVVVATVALSPRAPWSRR